MLARKEQFQTEVLQIIDSVLILLSFWLGLHLRGLLVDVVPFIRPGIGSLASISWIMFIVVPFGPLVLDAYGFYRTLLTKTVWQSVRQLLQALMIAVVVVGVGVIFFRPDEASRGVLLLTVPIGMGLLLLREFAVKKWLTKRIAEQKRQEKIVLCGRPADLEQFERQIPERVSKTWSVVSRFDLNTQPLAILPTLLHEHNVSRVIFSASHTEFGLVERAIELCEIEGVEAWLDSRFLRTSIARPVFDGLGDHPMIVFRTTPELSWQLLAKETFDKIFSLILLLCSLPIWVLAALAIKIQSPGAPVFYRQERAGRYGRPFMMWKFRTMIPDADKKLEELKEKSKNEMSGPVFKLDVDPRIFPVGRFLRKFSIDELPQLLNVLAGDMSMVGPRPMAVYEIPNIEKPSHRRKLSVKPGLTCIWQVSGRNAITSFEEWVALDLEYIDNWSLWLDFKIILKTIPAVLLAKGAK